MEQEIKKANKTERVIKAVLKENSLFLRTQIQAVTSELNKSSGEIAQYLSLIAQIMLIFVPLVLKDLAPKGDLEKLILCIFIILLISSILFGLVEKFYILELWKKEKKYTEVVASIWMQARNKRDSEIIWGYKEAIAKEESASKFKPQSSPSWPLIMQTLTAVSGLLIAVGYYLFKLFEIQ